MAFARFAEIATHTLSTRPSIDQIREDIAACEKIGAEELFLEVGFWVFTPGGLSLNNWQKLFEEFPSAGAEAAT